MPRRVKETLACLAVCTSVKTVTPYSLHLRGGALGALGALGAVRAVGAGGAGGRAGAAIKTLFSSLLR